LGALLSSSAVVVHVASKIENNLVVLKTGTCDYIGTWRSRENIKERINHGILL
jgi:predicted nuclease with RNAse H fold